MMAVCADLEMAEVELSAGDSVISYSQISNLARIFERAFVKPDDTEKHLVKLHIAPIYR